MSREIHIALDRLGQRMAAATPLDFGLLVLAVVVTVWFYTRYCTD